MYSPVKESIGPFVQGLNNVTDPSILDASCAVVAINADLSSQALQSLYGPGSERSLGVQAPNGGSADANYAWIGYLTGANWLGAQTPQWLCLDTEGTAYVTDISSGGTVSVPRDWYEPAGFALTYGSYPMGIPAPAALSTTNGSSAGARSYYVVFRTADGLTSNPYPPLGAPPVVTTECDGAVLTIPKYVNAVDGRAFDAVRDIYGTALGQPAGSTPYLLTTVTDNATTTWTDTGVATTLQALTWNAGGSTGNTVAPTDHSPWGPALLLSTSLHGAAPGGGASGDGLLFGTDSTGYTAVWSGTDGVQYQPIVNNYPLPQATQAIISQGWTTLYLMTNCIMSFSGQADYAIIPTRTTAERGVRAGCGQSAVQTPHGVMFLARDGIALFDGNFAPIITHGLLDPKVLNALTGVQAVFWDDRYFLYHSAGTIVVDMRDFLSEYMQQIRGAPSIKVTNCTEIVLGSWISPYNEDTDFPPGNYVMLSGERDHIRRWSLAETLAGSVKLPLTWQTPNLTFGNPSTQKLVTGCRPSGTGAATLSFYLDGSDTAACVKVIPDLSVSRNWFPLPRGLRCRGCSIGIVSAGTAVITHIELEATALNVA